MNISDEAVEAAAKALYESESYLNRWDWEVSEFDREEYRKHARASIEAAAPYLMTHAWDEGAYSEHDFDGEPVAHNPYRSAGAGE